MDSNKKLHKDNFLYTALKGLIVGASMLVPGVSGGSMAMILGIYGKLVRAVSSFFKDILGNVLFLGTFVLGAGIGMILFASPLGKLTENYNMIMMYFFMGAVAGGIPLIYKSSKVKKITAKEIFYIFIGALITLLINFIPEGIFDFGGGLTLASLGMLALGGIVIAVALILPGISVSYMLLVLGMYTETMNAIKSLYFPYLIPLALGVLLGVVLTTRILETTMNRYPEKTYLIILGFIIGSVVMVFPGLPAGMELLICPIMFLLGFIIIKKISSFQA
ncbi:DUF368 domain-containing protein [Alloiococcus sp. CFN-8]|uniref:DUF368 domain-containing protein n=1 Tax=Alloiococcus sp. CFN-8 TaxID=3416081 RepID=UPI003CF9B55E